MKYILCRSLYSPPLDIKVSEYASITTTRGMIDIIINSTAKRYAPDEQPRQPIPNILRSWMNLDLWKELKRVTAIDGGYKKP